MQKSQTDEEIVQETPDRNWLGQQDKITQLTTLSQATLLAHNIGVCNLIHSESMECKIPAQSEIQIQIIEDLYKSMMKETKSIGHIVSKVVHQIVTPLFLLQKMRRKMNGPKMIE